MQFCTEIGHKPILWNLLFDLSINTQLFAIGANWIE